jgi:hypothetical protein
VDEEMTNEDIRQRAAALHQLIVGASISSAWADSSDSDALPSWQRDVLSKILALTFDQDILYLSTAMPEGEDWDIIVFTDETVVRVLLVRNDGEPAHSETSAFPRSSLESLELMDVAPIPDDDEVWPSGLNLIGHYRSATVTLPLDNFASPHNRRDLERLLTSLLRDISH